MKNFIYNILIKLVRFFEKNIPNNIPENNQNFPVKVDGKTYWISRSCAVAGFVYVPDDKGNWYVLAEKRGKGCPDWNGYWCCPCGYLDYNEKGKDAIHREVYEETGLWVDSRYFKIVGVNFDIAHNQNITIRYKCVLGITKDSWEPGFSTEHMEHDEVEEIKFIPLTDIDKYQWAFGHQHLINEIFKTETSVVED